MSRTLCREAVLGDKKSVLRDLSRGCRRVSEGPALPRPGLINLLLAIAYLGHWFVVIPWVTLKMALFPKRLVWAKTSHRGEATV